ncbi:hypothetical protein BHM03_00000573 [Ensete ventricosum]|uniref:Uncharacterized protein n=1 Tax=Ensete ventricosum TaxID=4639 RepID=A0A445M8K1_ENSVE|nr:hypothetical protein BHM03_00000573 [Ensete ventricosum]
MKESFTAIPKGSEIKERSLSRNPPFAVRHRSPGAARADPLIQRGDWSPRGEEAGEETWWSRRDPLLSLVLPSAHHSTTGKGGRAIVFAAVGMQANGVNAAPATDCGVPAPSDAKGKHRISAELKRLEQEARFLEVKPSFSRPPLSLNSLVKEKSPERKINLLFTSFQSDFVPFSA